MGRSYTSVLLTVTVIHVSLGFESEAHCKPVPLCHVTKPTDVNSISENQILGRSHVKWNWNKTLKQIWDVLYLFSELFQAHVKKYATFSASFSHA